MLAVIRDLQSGSITAASLSVDDRRRCVEHLSAEGYSVPEIAEILKVAERTVARDRKAVRAANALQPDEDLVPETVGSLARQAEQSIARLRRIARERDTPPEVKVNAERGCWQVAREFVETLQKLGYLPTAPQEIRGELTHTLGDAPGYDQLQAEVTRLEVILSAGAGETDTEAQRELADLKSTLEKLGIDDRVRRLAASIDQGEPDDPPHADAPHAA